MQSLLQASVSAADSCTLALTSSANDSCNKSPVTNRDRVEKKLKAKRVIKNTYDDKVLAKETVDEMEKNVGGVLRVTLDAHHMIFILEHLYPCLLRPSYNLRLGWKLPHLPFSIYQTVYNTFYLTTVIVKHSQTHLVPVAFQHREFSRKM